MTSPKPPHDWPQLALVALVMAGLIALAWGAGRDGSFGITAVPEQGSTSSAPALASEASESSESSESSEPAGTLPSTTTPPSEPPASEPPDSEPPDSEPPASEAPDPRPVALPGGGQRVFHDDNMLVAYYGTAGTGSLGVLGEDPPWRMHQRLQRAGRAFARPGRKVQEVYELIVTVADRAPGQGRDYNHDIARADVQRYINAAHAHRALLVLDLQTGRTDFLTVAKRWAWALRDPWVGLALDPEWRLRSGVPGQRVGSVRAAEVNRTSAWLSALVKTRHLPEKVFMLHQFRTDMIPDVRKVVRRPGLAMVQHVDGFGTPGQKLGTYHAVARPTQFTMGFKLFYDEDVHRMSADRVARIAPRVRFVSFQ